MTTTHELQDVQDQSTALSRKLVTIIFMALALALFITCLDLTSVATSMPKIGKELNAVSSIAWVGTSFLIAMTAFLLINGRLSDIFGRKGCLLTCLVLLGLGDLLCGFAKSGVMLFMFRAISGIGAGGVNSLVMVIVSDITTLKERGKYQGILETMIALGNGVGPLVGGAFSQQVTWRWTFWFVVPLAALAAGVVWFLLPETNVEGDWKMKVAQIDHGGVLISMAAVVLLLIPISGGGSTYQWNSSLVIAMLTTGGLLAVLFVYVEWKLSPIPLMPLRLFRKRNAKILLANNFLMGIIYFIDLYFIPLYFQNVRGYSPIMSGVLILPLIVGFSIGSSTSGILISRIGITNPVIRTGFVLWTSGAGGRISWRRDTHIAVLVICQLIEGIGVGCCFQPAMIALLANTEKADRAVATGLRNFLRTTGGAVGLSIGSAILNNVLIANLPSTVSVADALQFTDLKHLTPEESEGVINAYMKGIQTIMYLGAPMVGIMLLDSLVLTEVRLDSLVQKSTTHVVKHEVKAKEAKSGQLADLSRTTAGAGGESQLFGAKVEAMDIEKGPCQ